MEAKKMPVPLALPGVLPQEFTIESAGHAIKLKPDLRHLDDALQGVQLRTGHERIEVAQGLRPLARQFSIAHTRFITHAGEQALGPLHTRSEERRVGKECRS